MDDSEMLVSTKAEKRLFAELFLSKGGEVARSAFFESPRLQKLGLVRVGPGLDMPVETFQLTSDGWSYCREIFGQEARGKGRSVEDLCSSLETKEQQTLVTVMIPEQWFTLSRGEFEILKSLREVHLTECMDPAEEGLRSLASRGFAAEVLLQGCTTFVITPLGNSVECPDERADRRAKEQGL